MGTIATMKKLWAKASLAVFCTPAVAADYATCLLDKLPGASLRTGPALPS